MSLVYCYTIFKKQNFKESNLVHLSLFIHLILSLEQNEVQIWAFHDLLLGRHPIVLCFYFIVAM